MDMDRLNAKLDALQQDLLKSPSKALKEINDATQLGFEEHFALQEFKYLAYAHGMINPMIAQWIYSTLGSTPDHFNGQRLAERVITLSILSETRKKMQARGLWK